MLNIELLSIQRSILKNDNSFNLIFNVCDLSYVNSDNNSPRKYGNKYRVKCVKNHLGYFNTLEEAKEVYDNFVKKVYGEFFRT